MKTIIVLTIASLVPLAVQAQAPNPSPSSTVSASAEQNVPAQPMPPIPPAPPAPNVPRHMHEHEDRPTEPVTFLGVETSDVPRVLSEQMSLPRGFGVVVNYVVPNSPAAAAGLQQSDIIRMLNDQIICDPGQLGKLVRSFADGTTVTLTIMRGGQEQKLPVKLTRHNSSEERGPFGLQHEWKFDQDGDNEFDFHMPDMEAVRETVARAREEALRAGDEAKKAARKLRIVTADDDTLKSLRVDLGKAKVTLSDERGELAIETVNGKKTLTAKDPQGNVLFSGPIETAAERDKIPAEVRKRLDKLESEDLPAVPPVPPAPPAPPAPATSDMQSVQAVRTAPQHVALCPTRRTGWMRSTIML